MSKRRLQVFVSSTFTDLQVERQAAVSAILKAGHIPAGMELFTAGDKSQWDTIKHWIDESDAYMLILGGRYGSVEPASGKSYTELEYDYAVEQKKPLFAVVINKDALEKKVKADGTQFMEKENPKELETFKSKVLSNISSFFDDPKDIKLCVHETLADYATNRDFKGWVRGDEVVDTKPLFEEIRKMSAENAELKRANMALEKRLKNPDSNESTSIGELVDLLDKIQVSTPASFSETKTFSLKNIFFSYRAIFSSGIFKTDYSSDFLDSFLLPIVCPRLKIHDLVMPQGKGYVVTPRGNQVLAEMEKRHVLETTGNNSIL